MARQKQISVSLSHEDFKKIDTIARIRRRSRSRVVCDLIRDGLPKVYDTAQRVKRQMEVIEKEFEKGD